MIFLFFLAVCSSKTIKFHLNQLSQLENCSIIEGHLIIAGKHDGNVIDIDENILFMIVLV